MFGQVLSGAISGSSSVTVGGFSPDFEVQQDIEIILRSKFLEVATSE